MIDENKKRIEKIKQKLKEFEQKGRTESDNFLKNPLLESLISSQVSTPNLKNNSPSQFKSQAENKFSYLNCRKFHDQAMQKREKDMLIQRRIEEAVIAKANEQKITQESLSILENNLKKKITMAILSMDPEMTKVLQYQTVRAILHKLDLFHNSSQTIDRQNENKPENFALFDFDQELHNLIHILVQSLKVHSFSDIKQKPDEIASELLDADNLFLVLSLLFNPRFNKEQKHQKVLGLIKRTLQKKTISSKI